MNALTIRQPWAEAICRGWKTIETRSWSAGAWWNGRRMVGSDNVVDQIPLAIHASATMSRDEREFAAEHGISSPTLGAVVAICTLTGCRRIDTDMIRRLSAQERAWGLYKVERWAWMLSDVQRLAIPVPARGRLGLMCVGCGRVRPHPWSNGA